MTMTETKSRSDLSQREKRIIGLLATSGSSNQQIAAILGIKPSTVSSHFRNIFNKVQVRTRQQLIVWAWHQQNHGGKIDIWEEAAQTMQDPSAWSAWRKQSLSSRG